MVFATFSFYTKKYLRGMEPRIPPDAFKFWADRAKEQIDRYTFNRIDLLVMAAHGDRIGNCTCELAEHLYMNEGNEGLASESGKGGSVIYEKGVPYRICQRHLSMTGLMYRGAGNAF